MRYRLSVLLFAILAITCGCHLEPSPKAKIIEVPPELDNAAAIV